MIVPEGISLISRNIYIDITKEVSPKGLPG
jgi:hypothetical protein